MPLLLKIRRLILLSRRKKKPFVPLASSSKKQENRTHFRNKIRQTAQKFFFCLMPKNHPEALNAERDFTLSEKILSRKMPGLRFGMTAKKTPSRRKKVKKTGKLKKPAGSSRINRLFQ